MTLPDKWVRKGVYDLINNMVVDAKTIPCYDVSATNYDGDNYVIMSTQTNTDDPTKCGAGFDHSILLDVVTRFPKNTGSRLLADNIAQNIITLMDGFTIGGGLSATNIRLTIPNDLTNETDAEIVHRKFLRYEMNTR